MERKKIDTQLEETNFSKNPSNSLISKKTKDKELKQEKLWKRWTKIFIFHQGNALIWSTGLIILDKFENHLILIIVLPIINVLFLFFVFFCFSFKWWFVFWFLSLIGWIAYFLLLDYG